MVVIIQAWYKRSLSSNGGSGNVEVWKSLSRIMEAKSTGIGEGLNMGIESKASRWPVKAVITSRQQCHWLSWHLTGSVVVVVADVVLVLWKDDILMLPNTARCSLNLPQTKKLKMTRLNPVEQSVNFQSQSYRWDRRTPWGLPQASPGNRFQ